MKINHLGRNNLNPSFGLKIQKDEGFINFVERACGKKWNCSKEEMEQFIQKLEDMHFAQEEKDDTCIVFGQAVKQVEGYRSVPSLTYRHSFVNEPIVATMIPCTLFKTQNPKEKTLRTTIKINGATLDDVLSGIASSYAKYMYSKK